MATTNLVHIGAAMISNLACAGVILASAHHVVDFVLHVYNAGCPTSWKMQSEKLRKITTYATPIVASVFVAGMCVRCPHMKKAEETKLLEDIKRILLQLREQGLI